MSKSSFPLSKVPKFYCSYLIRLWQDDDHLPWRASAQSVQTGTIQWFPDLESLFVFLAEQAEFEQKDLSPASRNSASQV